MTSAIHKRLEKKLDRNKRLASYPCFFKIKEDKYNVRFSWYQDVIFTSTTG